MTSFHVGDRVSAHVDGTLVYGTVVGFFEDTIFVQWDTGVLSTLGVYSTMVSSEGYILSDKVNVSVRQVGTYVSW